MTLTQFIFRRLILNLLRSDFDPLLSLGLLQLRDNNAQDTVLHAGLDVSVIDWVGKGETASEFTHAALGNPVGVLRVMFGDFIWSGSGHFLAGGLLDWLALAVNLGGWGWFGTFLPGAFGSSLDGQGLLVCKLDYNVLLVNAGKLAFKNVALLGLLDVEFGGEGAGCIVG